ncbi:AbrB family transcriptional regulator [Cypionkella psychrotolerans]|uniref:AbrB family transcriptional regulator n=1 Tax=Cypionkella psychrotolerans TaxID=1678131 RepID=UPI0006B4E90A|nr:AbrB family transcriptional regulator [Cypionkella psychrotolerans]
MPQTPPPSNRRAQVLQWAALALLSALITAGFEALHLPAALLLGPMIAAIMLALRGFSITLPGPAMTAAQGIVGLMVATILPISMMTEVAAQWPIVLAGTLSTIAASALLGWLLARSGALPGTTAIWGSSPGAASAMVLLSGAYGADIRLVAFMQYLRVACVAVVATVVARLFGVAGEPAPIIIWFPEMPALGIAQTLALAVVLAFVGQRLRLPGATFLLPIGTGMLLMQTGWMQIYLPPWLLALTYAAIGWAIGLRFTPATLGHALRAFPRVFASIMALIAVCGGAAWVLVQFAGIDPLTAYLATSPGGMDSVAIIAASTPVDVAFVMTMHMARFLLILLLGPILARWLSRPKGF